MQVNKAFLQQTSLVHCVPFLISILIIIAQTKLALKYFEFPRARYVCTSSYPAGGDAT
jgi:hypothetical protein